MWAIELIVEGNVQRVGYRNFVSQAAFDLGMNGSIENRPDGRVKIIVQGKEKQLNEFIKRIRIKEWPVAVRTIKKKEIEIREKFNEFKIIRGPAQNELSERADEAVIYMQKMYIEMKSFRNETKSSSSDLLSETRGGFSKNISETRLLRKDTNQNFNKMDGKYDKMSTKMDNVADTLKQTNKTLKEEFGKLSGALINLASKSVRN